MITSQAPEFPPTSMSAQSTDPYSATGSVEVTKVPVRSLPPASVYTWPWLRLSVNGVPAAWPWVATVGVTVMVVPLTAATTVRRDGNEAPRLGM